MKFFDFLQSSVFLYAFCWNNEYICGNINRIWVQRIYRKLIFSFSFKTYYKLPWVFMSIYLFFLLIKILKLINPYEKWWRHQKRHEYRLYFSIFWKVLFSATLMHNFIATSELVQNLGTGSFFPISHAI